MDSLNLRPTPLQQGVCEPLQWFEFRDESMAPEIPKGSAIGVDPGGALRAGCLVVVRTNGGALFLRRYTPISNDVYLAEPVNPTFETLYSDIHGLEILAVCRRVTKRL